MIKKRKSPGSGDGSFTVERVPFKFICVDGNYNKNNSRRLQVSHMFKTEVAVQCYRKRISIFGDIEKAY